MQRKANYFSSETRRTLKKR